MLIDDDTGTVKESWTGHQVEWQMARGYEGSFGHKLNAPYVWIPLCVLFLLGLLDWRRPWRVVHLDLLVLLAFSVSQIYFNRGEIGVSVPLVYPVLAYLLARVLWIGFRGVAWGFGQPPRFLAGDRGDLPDRVQGGAQLRRFGADRRRLRGRHRRRPDHAPDPIWGWGIPRRQSVRRHLRPRQLHRLRAVRARHAVVGSGTRFRPPTPPRSCSTSPPSQASSSSAAACGRERPAPRWESCSRSPGSHIRTPTTRSQSNSNDTLLAALVIWSLVFFGPRRSRSAARGGDADEVRAAGAGAAVRGRNARALALAAEIRGGGERRAWLRTALAFVAVFVLASALFLAIPAVDSGLATFWDRTVVSQADRTSPFQRLRAGGPGAAADDPAIRRRGARRRASRSSPAAARWRRSAPWPRRC